MLKRVHERLPELELDAPRFLIERMAPKPVGELLVGLRRDPAFGPAMTIAAGGVLAELMADAVTLLLPASPQAIGDALARLRTFPLLTGYRGGSVANIAALVDTLDRLARKFAERDDLIEIEINPLFVTPEDAIAIDALITTAT